MFKGIFIALALMGTFASFEARAVVDSTTATVIADSALGPPTEQLSAGSPCEQLVTDSVPTPAESPNMLRKSAPFLLFVGGILLLIIGYFTYGKYIERLLSPDDRTTPAVANFDGVDYVEMPQWKNALIQLLNIAGVGPVIGVILGMRFGIIAFLIIPIGNIIGGAVHDFLAGMMSLRHNGANLPFLIKKTLGVYYFRFFSVFMCFLLLLVVAVFINIPANLLDKFFLPGIPFFWYAVVAISIYYILATLFPVDKIIGAVYPIFGFMLLLGSGAIFVVLIKHGINTPELFSETPAFREMMWNSQNNHPILPLLFVTIACGIISGFHATQSPIVARTMKTEKEARPTYYGMMILEGIIGMVWAGSGMVIYNLFPELFSQNASNALVKITTFFLGESMGGITILAVVILAITSGDTALRSLRLSLAEILGVSQKPVLNRIMVCLPLIVIIGGLLAWSNISAKSFNNLWNYFAWGNQVLAASTLFAMAIWLKELKKPSWPALLPGFFMSFVVISFILWTSPSHPEGGPWGLGLELNKSYWIAGVVTALLGGWVWHRGRRAEMRAK